MTVSQETPTTSSTANGVTTVFPYAFTVLLAGDLVVHGVLAGVTTSYTLGVDYTLTGVGTSSGSVVFSVAPANGTIITRYRSSSISRSTDYQENGDLPSATLDLDFDRVWLALQEILSGGQGVSTSIRVPNDETVLPLVSAANRANKSLGFDASGNPTVLTPVAGTAASVLTLLADTASPSNNVSLLGWLRAATGAVATTLYAWLDWQNINVFEFLTFAQKVDVKAYTFGIDTAVAVQATLTAASAKGKRAKFPGGGYAMTARCTIPADVSVSCDGIGVTQFKVTAANTGAFNWADASLPYLEFSGCTITGAGRGAATSIGLEMGRATRGTYYCKLKDVEVTNFGDANIRVINGFRCDIDNIYPHGDATGVLGAANIGLHLLGTYAFVGSNYDNRIGYVEAYNNVRDIKVELGGKNNFTRPYVYNQLYIGTVNHIHEVDSSLNVWHRPHIEPLSLSAGGTPMWLIESTLANPYTYMLGPVIYDLEYENGTLGTTTNVIQIGVVAENIVYGTQIINGKWMPVSGGKFHAVLTNEQSTQITFPAVRNNTTPFDRLIRDLTISNPNAATNNSYVGSFYEASYGTWTPVIKAAGVNMATTISITKAEWSRSAKTVEVWLDFTLTTKNANAGAVTISGIELISPNGGTTVFSPSAPGTVPINFNVYTAAGVRLAWTAYMNASTGLINLLVDATGVAVANTDVVNGMQFTGRLSFRVA